MLGQDWGGKNGFGRDGGGEGVNRIKTICRYDILEDNKMILKTEFGEYTEACSNSHN